MKKDKKHILIHVSPAFNSCFEIASVLYRKARWAVTESKGFPVLGFSAYFSPYLVYDN